MRKDLTRGVPAFLVGFLPCSSNPRSPGTHIVGPWVTDSIKLYRDLRTGTPYIGNWASRAIFSLSGTQEPWCIVCPRIGGLFVAVLSWICNDGLLVTEALIDPNMVFSKL